MTGTSKNLLAILVLLAAASGPAVADSTLNEGVTAPYLLPESRVAPEYPPAAFDARMEGQVTIAALVLADGSVAHVETLDCSAPNIGFEQATADAVKRWRFEPGQKAGEKIDAYSVVRLNFRRTGGSTPSGYVTAGFMPLEMLRASIIAGATNPAGLAQNASPTGYAMSTQSDTGATKVGVPAIFYDPKSPWVPEQEATLDTNYFAAPDIDPIDK